MTSQSLITLSKFIAIVTDPLVLLTLSLIISALLYIKKQKSKAILLSTASISTVIIIKLLKNIFQIARPTSNLILETGYSFPSGHTTFAVVFFGLLVYIFAKKQNRTPAIITSTIIVIIIALSRLYLQVHWLTDIIGGVIIGTAILTISILINSYFFK